MFFKGVRKISLTSRTCTHAVKVYAATGNDFKLSSYGIKLSDLMNTDSTFQHGSSVVRALYFTDALGFLPFGALYTCSLLAHPVLVHETKTIIKRPDSVVIK